MEQINKIEYIDIIEVAKDIAQVLEKHSVKMSDVDSVLDSTKNIISARTPVHVE